jgi:endonuclease/exonuclease/phosphatase family metal-dependent hydrolase
MLRVATFNLKDFFLARNTAEEPIVRAKLANVATSLRRAAADIVALQEVGGAEILAQLVASVPELGYGEPIVGSEDRRGIRNVILTRLPVQWAQVHQASALPFPRFVDTDPEPFAGRLRLRRGVVHVRVDAGALGEIDVLTGHFKSGRKTPLRNAAKAEIEDPLGESAGALRSFVQRAAEALFVRGLVDGIFAKSPDHAICVMGDFNDRADSVPLQILRGDRTPLHAAADALAAERRFSVLHGGTRALIDHILVSSRLHAAARSYEIHNEALRDHGPHVDDGPLTEDSDHALSLLVLDDHR